MVLFMEPTYKRVCRVIGQLSGIDPATIGPGQSLGQRATPNFYWQSLVINSTPPKPVGLDSLDLVQLAMALEDEFGITISDDEVDSPAIDHVGGLVAFVQGKLDAQRTFWDGYEVTVPRISDAAEPQSDIHKRFDWPTKGIDLNRPGAEL